MQPDKDNLPEFATKLSSVVFDNLTATSLEMELSIPADLPSWELPAPRRHHLLMIAKEALRNVVQHARATRVVFKLGVQSAAYTRLFRR